MLIRILEFFFPSILWRKKSSEKILYLTFDDGPHPIATPFALETLARFNAKATFFCLGKNAEQFPELMTQIKDQGHRIGNHSYSHPDGWKTKHADYIADIEKCEHRFSSALFRPPYGRISLSQLNVLSKKFTLVMWDVNSRDYVHNQNQKYRLKKMIEKTQSGSVILFHDSTSSFENMKSLLPQYLSHFSKEGFQFSPL